MTTQVSEDTDISPEEFALIDEQFHRDVDQEVWKQSVRHEARAKVRRLYASPPKFEAIGSATSAARNPDETPWLVDQLLPAKRFSLLVAQSGVGKTTLLLHFAKSLLSGEPFLRKFPVVQNYERNILFVNADMTEREYDDYIQNIGGFDDRLMVWHVPSGDFDVLNDEHIEQFAEMCAANNIGYVIMDVWGAVFPENEDGNSDARRGANNLIALISKVGLDGVMLVHHAGKDYENRVQARGASSLEGAASVIWRMKGTNAGNSSMLTAEKRIRRVPWFEVAFNRDTWESYAADKNTPGSYMRRKEEVRRAKEQNAMVRLLIVAANQPGIGMQALITKAGGNYASMAIVVEQLVTEGLLDQTPSTRGGKRHDITALGEQFLASRTE